MKKKVIVAVVCALCLLVGTFAVGCDKNENETPSSGQAKDMTLNGVGMLYGKDEYKPMTKIRTLDDIYFPDGILETGLGMWIYKIKDDSWVRTDSAEGRDLFNPSRPTFISTHGMGGGAVADDPDIFYEAGYNVLCFEWGTYADEDNAHVGEIVDKVWLSDYTWMNTDKNKYIYGARWLRNDDTWVDDDPADASVIEMYCAYYYDLLSHFPEYSGSCIELFGHSYGGMISIGATSLLITAFRCGLLPAYMLPDKITMMDPYMMRCSAVEIEWLGENTPPRGNIAEVCYQTALECQKLGIAVRLFRFTKSVAYPAVMHHFADGDYYQGDLNISYWNYVNSVLYAHLTDDTIKVFNDDMGAQHNYAWDWYTEYYTGTMLKDSCATKTDEQAFCFKMDYDAVFAHIGMKYNVDLNGTLDTTDDDILYSFYREYKYDGKSNTYPSSDAMRSETPEEVAELHGKAKVAGFVYFDRNGNDKMDERIMDHLSGAKITVTNEEGEVLYTATTTINGYYEYEVESEGKYTVKVELPKGYALSTEEASDTSTAEIIDPYYQLALHNFGAKKK